MRVSYNRFGFTKSCEVFPYELLEYKLKGEHRYHKDKIVVLQDSTIVFENSTEIKLNQIKALRLRKNVHLASTVQGVFLGGAIAFVGLNTLNNVITDTSPVFNERAAYVSLGLLGVSLIFREMNLKRVRVTDRTDLKILNIDFQHLNTDSSSVSR